MLMLSFVTFFTRSIYIASIEQNHRRSKYLFNYIDHGTLLSNSLKYFLRLSVFEVKKTCRFKDIVHSINLSKKTHIFYSSTRKLDLTFPLYVSDKMNIFVEV